ncbi:PAS domain S-box protein [Methylomonas sp. SURF-1]|uniref:histidine kinase n=1 Tax=Methylomonas aurea TaxID=2952224 RepID=A0ABT1UFL5_9GAMM|nr:PAS domain S-box protein [Methylomonas sp. SURF-1]MCQ8180821.1 PAS domain S-box protein [Methylomonas sp. SURF-1]
MNQPASALAPFKQFIDTLPDATLLLDSRHRILFANSVAETVFGYTRAELEKLDIDLLLPPRFRAAHHQQRQSYMADPAARRMGSDLNLWGLHKSGREFPLEIGLSPLQTEPELIIVCSVRDISHLKQAERALINDERFRLFLAHAPSAIAMFDRDMRYLAVSRRWLEDYRLERRDIIGLSHYEVFPDIPDRWRAIHRRCLAGEVLRTDEDVFVRADGRTDWVKWEMCPWYADDGNVGGAILFTEVITARKETEIKLRNSKDQFHKIFDNAVTGIAITGLAGRFQYCNSAYCAITGYTLAELQNLEFRNLIHPDDLAANLAEVRRVVGGEIASFVIENRYIAKSGQPVWVRKYGSTLPGDPMQLMVIAVDINQLKQIELDLQQSYRNLAASERLFRSLIESMPQMAWIADSAGVIRFANTQWLAYLDCPNPQHPDDVWFAQVHPNDRQRAIMAWERAIREHASFNLECRLLNFDNSYRWWQIRVVALHKITGDAGEWLGICTDIHDLKREEEALELLNSACFRLWQTNNLEDGLQEMLTATMGLLQTDMGNIQLLSKDGDLQIVAQQGFRQDFLDFIRSVSPSTPTACRVALSTRQRKVISDVEQDPFFAPFRDVARQAGFRAVQSTPLMSREGQPIGVISTHFRSPRALDSLEAGMLDIYAQQAANFIKRCQAETKLRQSEEHFRNVFNNALVGISVRDRSGNLLDCNTAYCNLLEYSREELQGLPLNKIMYSADIEAYLRNFRELTAGNIRFFQVEARYVCKSGALHWVNQYVCILHKQNGEQETVLTVVSDISALKHSQAELRDNKRHLETAVKARTQELKEALIAAEKANEFKTRFLNAASHDLRQPLQSADLYLSVLAKRLEASDSKALCDDLHESIAMMGSILDALLDIARLESGIIVPSKRDFPLRELFDRLAATTVPQAAIKGIRLDYRHEDCTIHSDPALLERVVGNLVANAIKYTERGQITVSCTCCGRTARISVEDTGIGMPPDSLAHIFEAYYQVNNAERHRDKGLGLGLAIVKHIADILGLQLAVASQAGVGSVFSVEVPLGSALPPSAAVVPVKPAVCNNSSSHILFIDDDPAICKAVKMLFEAHGISGYFVQNGEAAMAAIADGLRPSLIISDYQLPGLDGIETVDRIRAAAGVELPALIVTGNTGLTKTLGKQLPNCKAFSKPLEPERLLELIASYLPAAGA